MRLPTKLKPRSVKQAAKAVEKALLFYDRSLLVVNKPTDMTCQLSYSTSAQYEKFNILCKGIQMKLDMPVPPRPIHRLDKNTTGALFIARTPLWASRYQKQFLEKKVKKTYLALVHGGKEDFPQTSGVIEVGLSEDDGRVRLDPEGKKTKTEWEVLGSSPRLPLSLLRLNPITGHKHQLRIHLARYLKTPILGDELYATKVHRKQVTDLFNFPRKLMYLHSWEMALERWHRTHPKAPFELKFRVPVPSKFHVMCRDAKIPIDLDLLKKGGMWVSGQKWENPNYLARETEPCWVSPILLGTEEPETDSDIDHKGIVHETLN